MDEVTNGRSKGDSFAVTRNYAPERIERELLARVFEIVECGVRPTGAWPDDWHEDVNPRSKDAKVPDNKNENQLALEPVA